MTMAIVKVLDAATPKGRNGHKGRTFGGVAACPHCSAPIRLYFSVVRTQCVLDVVCNAYSLPPYPADGEPDGGHVPQRTRNVVAVANAVSVTTDTGAPTAASDIDAPSVAHPNERGFDDDEAPFPT